MRLCLLRIDPLRLDIERVDACTDVKLVANDHERDVWVVCCRLEGLLPLDHFLI